MQHVFISYMSENEDIVDRLCEELTSRGIKIWLDRNDIKLGSRWKDAIREAIREGAFFATCFSKEYNKRAKTYMNEELTIAIQELRQRPTDRIWFIPVKLNKCEIPDRNIGAGETLKDLQYVNLYENWDVGIQCILKAIQSKSPELKDDYPNTYFQRGVAYYAEDKFHRAIDDFSTVISLTPDDSFAYYVRGMAYRNLLVFEKAIQDFSTAIRLKPDAAAEAYTERGVTYHCKGDIEKAIEDYNTAIALDPKFPKAYTERGKTYRDKGEGDKAIADYDKAIELNPELAEPYTCRGSIYKEQGEVDKAIEDHSKAIELDPEFAEAYLNRGQAYDAKNELDRAIADYDKAIQLSPKLVEAYTHRGNAYRATDELDSAIADYTKALKLRPKVAESYYTRGETWLLAKGWEAAKTDLTAAILQGVDVAAVFHNTHGSIAAFEQKIGVRLPKEVVELLTPQSEPFEIERDCRAADPAERISV